MPLFDEEHTYDSATNILPADDQVIFSGSIPSLGTLEGSSAITLIGNNRARWQPLLTLTDADGEVRGTAARSYTSSPSTMSSTTAAVLRNGRNMPGPASDSSA